MHNRQQEGFTQQDEHDMYEPASEEVQQLRQQIQGVFMEKGIYGVMNVLPKQCLAQLAQHILQQHNGTGLAHWFKRQLEEDFVGLLLMAVIAYVAVDALLARTQMASRAAAAAAR